MASVLQSRPAESAIGRVTRARDLTLAGGLVLAALALRLPYLWDIPRLTDELQEILWALAIARGEILPLTAVDSYYGPLWSYLLALVFRLIGLSDWAPRLVAAVLASITVGLTYLIGRELVGRWAAMVGALLLLTSGGHVIITSHTARSNSTTPLLLLLLVWVLHRATRDGNGRLLVLGGFLFALALQTHISVIAFAPGLALAVLLLRPSLVRTRWTGFAIVAAIVGYGNMILYNLLNDFYSLNHAQHLQEGYTSGRSTDLAVYLENLQALVQSLSRLLSGTIDIPTSPARFIYIGLALAGMALLASRRSWLVVLFCFSAILVLPYFNPRYGPILSGRYLIPLLPFCFMAAGIFIETAARRLPRERVVRSAAALLVVSFPLLHLVWYYQEVLADERTNAPLYALAESARAVTRDGDRVYLDEILVQESLTGGGNDLKALRMLLETRGLKYEVIRVSAETLRGDLPPGAHAVIIMDPRKRQQMERQFPVVTEGAVERSASGSGRRYGVYRVMARDRTET